MKVTLDLSKLLRDGAITLEEHDRLARLGRQDTGLLLVNVLVGFGVFAVSGGAVALLPNAVTGLVLGGVLMAAGAGLMLSRRADWAILANICILTAALLLGAGILLLSQGVTGLRGGTGTPVMSVAASCLVVAALFAATGALARSSLLAMLTVLMLFAALGSSTGYGHAAYELEVQRPLATVVLFSAVALAALWLARFVPAEWERPVIAVARTALFLVNLGFWIGSLWGDDLGRAPGGTGMTVPALAFTIAWAVALLATAIWAGQTNRRWVLNLVTVFGGIHFYTQWFERLGATPGSVLAAGLLVLVFAVGLWRLNRHLQQQDSPA